MKEKYDQMVNALFMNMYTLSKEDGEIYLYNFNRKDSRHWAAIHIASLLKDISGRKLAVNTSLLNYLWIKWKFPKLKGIKRTKKANINIEKEVAHIERTYEAEGHFSNIYRDYYHFTDRK